MKTYYIKKTDIDNVPINSQEWENANTAQVNTEAPESTKAYKTTCRMLYSNGGISVKMETDEDNLYAEHSTRDSNVYEDSCMEVFIGSADRKRYFNFEINYLGALLLGIGSGRDDRKPVDVKTEVFDIQCTFENDKWQLKFYIPFKVYDDIFGYHGRTFCGNIYKCGEHTEYEHYLMWNEVKNEGTDFHDTNYFGEFVLE